MAQTGCTQDPEKIVGLKPSGVLDPLSRVEREQSRSTRFFNLGDWMKTYTLPDNTLIEYQYHDMCLAPGQTGLHCNTTALWYRVDGGGWRTSQYKSMHTFETWMGLCLTKSDIKGIL